MIGNKIVNKTTSVSKKKPVMELHSKELPKNYEDVEITAHKKIYISPEEREQVFDELRLVPKKDAYFKKLLMN